MKVALVYDRINKWGGAERVLLALHEIFPDAPLYTSVYSKENAKWAKVFKIKTTYLQKTKYFQKHNEVIAGLVPSAFESLDFSEYDLVISVTSEAAKGVLTNVNTKHICYCLTPTRYLWSGYDDYFQNKYIKFLSTPIVRYLKYWDKIASSRPDNMIAISTEVKKRIKKYYERDSEIIFPPVLDLPRSKRKTSKKYFLLVSRLSKFTYYKKVDLAIDTFNETKLPLIIVGSGPMRQDLEKRANKNIKFVGDLTDESLAYYYENCLALVFPGLEDFGLVMAEAQFYGKPVIAYKGGGALDIVKPGITGEFFDKQTVKSFSEALKNFDQRRYNKRDIVRHSNIFGYKEFKKNIESYINNL
ncbi:glycosyltransferase family 4 protein [Candidatus Dojkabacteria bacterium]|uniref:Glycosyltransferase family 4 protein n=1 Tax=Candidatus Dojkabacteria bacterium TaxID=2099670 RepID=A0A5C7J2S3_9BACT|nr:MAG: glycosyltransferase family 4 protein [Candidatus Dojkabacteria bacterium]